MKRSTVSWLDRRLFNRFQTYRGEVDGRFQAIRTDFDKLQSGMQVQIGALSASVAMYSTTVGSSFGSPVPSDISSSGSGDHGIEGAFTRAPCIAQ